MEIGDYHVVQALGPGRGLGRAYQAVSQTKKGSDRRYLVVCVPAKGLKRSKILADIDKLKSLRHAAVPPVVDTVEQGDELAVVFETDEGLWLDQIQQHLHDAEERLSDKAIGQLGHQLAGALAAAHAAKDESGRRLHLIHGDLGPDRVLISWGGSVRVYGIGLAAVLEGERSDLARSFAAPERKKDSVRVPQSDLYTAAAMIWSLLAGRPFPPDAKPQPLAEIRPKLSKRLCDGIDRALYESAARRTTTCEQLSALLCEEIDGASDPKELQWNMDLFKALSLFSNSLWPSRQQRKKPKPSTATSAEDGSSPSRQPPRPAAKQPKAKSTPASKRPRSKSEPSKPSAAKPDDAAPTAGTGGVVKVPTPLHRPRVAQKSLARVTLLQSRFGRDAPEDDQQPVPTIPAPKKAAPDVTSEDEEIEPEPITLPGDIEPPTQPVGALELESEDSAPEPTTKPKLPGALDSPPSVRTVEPEPKDDGDAGGAGAGRFDGAEESVIARLSGIFDETPPPELPKQPAKTPSAAARDADGSGPASAPAPAARASGEDDAVIIEAREVGPSAVLELGELPEDGDDPDLAVVTRRSPTPPKPIEPPADRADPRSYPPEPSPQPATPSAPPKRALAEPAPATDDAASQPSEPPPDESGRDAVLPSTSTAEPAVAKRRRGIHPLMAVIGMTLVGAIAFVAAWSLKPSPDEQQLAEPPPGPTPEPTETTAAGTAAAPTASAEPAPTVESAEPADANAAPESEPGAAPGDGGQAEAAAPSAEPDDSGDLPPVADELGGDGSELLSYEGYLVVRSRARAEVFVQGVHRGPTNSKLKSRCHQKFVRLRDGAAGEWLTAGQGVRIACMSTTTVTINP
ncbi:MAG: protein kinase [Deltaproteobacteria bacterium]|nr:protein kinase [Deltaproteobacteria bacterium]